MKKQPPSRYRAYLLRCWQASDADNQSWRFSLEGVQDARRQGFADLESLLAFLQQITQSGGESDECNVSS